MKFIHDTLNKKSRLVEAPSIVQPPRATLAAFDARRLAGRLHDALRVQNDFYPCFDWMFPPPVTQRSRALLTPESLFAAPAIEPGTYSIYLHVPFCASLCQFCYYPVLPGRADADKQRYVDYLIREMSLYAPVMRGQRCESIYLGGGTPTSLPPELLVQLFDELARHFDWAPDVEITIESAPGTISRQQLALLHALGTTRLSYGIQTLDAARLAALNRHYTVDGAIRELSDALDLIGNVNIDTMYGFEGEADEALLATLSRFAGLGIPSISIYALDEQRCNPDRAKDQPSRDRAYDHKRRIFLHASEFLARRGYRPILQNIFVKPGEASYRHQLRRWENVTQLALGMSSMGYAPRRLYQNHLSLKQYMAALDEGRLPIAEHESLTPELEVMREVVSRLRFTSVDLTEIRRKYRVDVGGAFADLIQTLTDMGYLANEQGWLRMTDRALPYNNIIPMLFAPDSFKELIYGLPEEFRDNFPMPFALTRAGATQSAPLAREAAQ